MNSQQIDDDIQYDEQNDDKYFGLKYNQLPWIEKYRPKIIDDLILPDSLRFKIVNFIEEKSIPNLILTGSPGIGKTTSVRCIARGLYGKYYDRAVLELNASDDRGSKSIHGDLLNFCKSVLPYRKNDIKCDKYPRFKFAILDEADNMIDRAQYQISMLMEKFKDTARFVFTCNSSSEINESIQSRCLILHYMKMNVTGISKRLEQICKLQNVKYELNAINYIASISNGDMRNSINMLQLLYNKRGTIKRQYVDEICDMPQSMILKKIFDHVLNHDLHSAIKIILELKENGYTGSDIILGMIHTIKTDVCDHIPEKNKIIMQEYICMTEYRISRGLDSNLQITSCLADLVKLNL